MTPQPITDAVGLSIVIATLTFSPEVAAVVGPYVLIAVCGVLGASFSLRRREPSGRLAAVGYFLKMATVATVFASGAAALVASTYPALEQRSVLAPAAFFIGFLDWPTLLGKAGSALFRVIDLFRSTNGEQK